MILCFNSFKKDVHLVVVKDVAPPQSITTMRITVLEATMIPIITNKRTTMKETMIIVSTMMLKKVIDIMAIIVIDLEETVDKAMIDRAMEITEEVTMIESGKAIEIGPMVGEIGTIMTTKLKIMVMTEIIRVIEETGLGEIEMIIEVEEMAVEGGITMMVITILEIGDAEEMVVIIKTTTMNQRRERFIFHRKNLMTKVPYLETMCQWE